MSFLTAVLLCYTSYHYTDSLSLPLYLSSLSLSVVTRGIMGLSYSRQDVDALNSNIKLFPAVPDMSSSLHFSCLTGLEGVQSMNHDTAPNRLWQVIHASYAKLFPPVSLSLSFACQQKHKSTFMFCLKQMSSSHTSLSCSFWLCMSSSAALMCAR